MAINRTSPKKGKVVDIPTVPTVGSATAGAESATVAYTASTIGGPATTFTALSNPGSITGTGSSSPITVTGLTAGTAYTFTVRGNNATGSSEYSSASNSITALVSTAYESITTVTLSSSAASISFGSIPQTYKHLQIRMIIRSTVATTGGQSQMRINGDTGANYTYHTLYGSGSAAAADGGGSMSWAYGIARYSGGNDLADTFGGNVLDFVDYSNTSKFKTLLSFGGYDANGSGQARLHSMVWLNSNAITSLYFENQGGGSFAAGTQFALYGIKG